MVGQRPASMEIGNHQEDRGRKPKQTELREDVFDGL
jgi:hypothetical protein